MGGTVVSPALYGKLHGYTKKPSRGVAVGNPRGKQLILQKGKSALIRRSLIDPASDSRGQRDHNVCRKTERTVVR